MAVKNIDSVDVKQAIKDGQLEVYEKYNPFYNEYTVYLKDKNTDDTVRLIKFSKEEIEKSWI